jgi:hypothetical protein
MDMSSAPLNGPSVSEPGWMPTLNEAGIFGYFSERTIRLDT